MKSSERVKHLDKEEEREETYEEVDGEPGDELFNLKKLGITDSNAKPTGAESVAEAMDDTSSMEAGES